MLTFMATQMSAEKDKEQLMTTFKAMDKDNNGILSKEELRAGISQIPGFIMDNEEVDKMIKKIDGNDNGEVDYTGNNKYFLSNLNQNSSLLQLILKNYFLPKKLSRHLKCSIRMAMDLSKNMNLDRLWEALRSMILIGRL